MESSVMDQLCGSEFWNADLTWETDDPDFTECFKKTVLVWFPCAILWILCPLEIYMIRNTTKRSRPRNWLLMSKMGLMCVIVSLSIADLAMAIYSGYLERISNVEYYTPLIKILTITMAVILFSCDKLCGRRNSGPLFVFWLLLVLCGAVQCRSTIRSLLAQVQPKYHHISFLIYYSVVCAVFILNFFAEGKPLKNEEQSPAEQTSPLEFCSFPTYVLFISFDKLAWKGFRRSLEDEDLWLMKYEDTANGTGKAFDKYWQKALKRVASYGKIDPSCEMDSGEKHEGDEKTKKIISVVPVVWKAFRPIILAGACLKLAESILLIVSPQILKLLINFVSGDAPLWKGYVYAGSFLAVRSICTLSTIHYAKYMRTTGIRTRTALTGAIYQKSLKITNSARKDTTIGEIVNLISVDVQALVTFSIFAHQLWASPMDIAITLYFLWNILGVSVFAGFAIMIVSVPFHMHMSNKVLKFKNAQMKKKDSRVKLINEILNGIKVLKLCAWELCFERQITKIRKEEMDILRNYWFCNVGMTFAWTWIPSLVCLVSLTTYVLTDESHVLDAPTVFVSLSLFNLMQIPMATFPEVIATSIQALVSVRRINKFMNAEELDDNDVQHDSGEVHPLVIENGTFSWTDDKSVRPTLRNINLHVKTNECVAIVGTVGSGKTSLLSALLGEIDRFEGRVNTKGTIAYVSQQAWIQNASVRMNILFGSPYNEKLYKRVIDGCALAQDLEVLPAGDRTEIGEKGINLSGGQKQRISLARAVYNGADVYLFDDPLSAVDAHVGKHIFDNVIGPNGMLKEKTRVIVTHGIRYLCEVDNIFVLNDGEITERGTYNQLLNQKGAFSELLINYLQTDTASEINGTNTIRVSRVASTIVEEKAETKSSNIIPPACDNIFMVSEPSPKKVSVMEPKLDIQTAIKKRSGGLFRRRHTTKKDVAVIQDKGKYIEAENMEKGIVKWKIYYHYICSIGGYLTLLAIVVRILYEICSIGAHMWLTIWTADTNTTVDGVVDIDRRNTYLGVYGALTTGQAIFTLMTLLVLAVGTVRSSRLLHDKLLFSILRVPVSFFEVTPSGRILNRFGKDIDTVDSILPRVFKAWLYSFVTVSGAIIVITYSTPIFISVIIPLAIVYYFIQCVYLASSRQLMRLQSISRSPILSFMSESIAGCQTIRAYRVQARFGRESERLIDVNQVRSYCSMIADRWLMLRLEVLGNLVVFFAALFAVLQRDTLSAGLVGLSVTYGLQVTNYLQWLVKSASELESNIISVERIKEYDNVAREAPWEIAENTPAKEWPQEGRIEFRDYKLRYREGLDLALRGLTFSVKGSEKVGIVGRTGAGKSSLALALFRIIESAGGQIIIDDVDISTIGLHSLRSKLTIIPQDPVLFSGTVRMNLDPFDLHTDEEVWAALENAELKKFVQGLEGGLMHEISEGGGNLSVGQRQLVCLARALLRKTKIIVLDEATASVDVETDDFIQKTIRKEFADCTILTIAHRLNTILDSDKVIVLNGGRVTECGSPRDLLQNRNSEFYSMAKDAGLVG